MDKKAETSLYKLKGDDEIRTFLLGSGWSEEASYFFAKKFSSFNLVLEREDHSSLGWHILITGTDNFHLKNNVALKNEINVLKGIFTGFWFRDDAYKNIVGHEVSDDETKHDAYMPECFTKDKDKIQYLVSMLLGSGADFVFDNEYFLAYYADNTNRNKLQLKIIKIEDQVNLHFDKSGNLFFANGEKLI